MQPQPVLWYLEEPITAIGLGGYYETDVCSSCGRGSRRQVADAHVELLPGAGDVCLTDSDAVLISDIHLQSLVRTHGGDLRPVTASWRVPTPSAVPRLFQVLPGVQVNAAGVRYSPCSCGSVEHIAIEPLLLKGQSPPPQLAVLGENRSTILVAPGLRQAFDEVNGDLVWRPAFLADTYDAPTRTFDGADWSDLV